MAKRFFNQKVPNTKKTIIQIVVIVLCIIGVVICFLLANYFNNETPRNAVIELRESVSVEINTELPDKLLFFSELQNADEDKITVDLSNVDITKVGEYPVELEIYNKTYESIVNIVDTKAPNVTVRELTTADTYEAKDFIDRCVDNSKEVCIVEFYTMGLDQEGNVIDYSSYTVPGTYEIQIIAKDGSNNSTVKTALLTITGDGAESNTQDPLVCKYGGGTYDEENYILAVNITQSGCAIYKGEYEAENRLAPVNALAEAEEEKLKKEFQILNIHDTISLEFNKIAIPNTDDTGIVGYSLHVDLSIIKDDTTELVESYYLRSDGTRVYSVNKYNLD